MKTKIFALLAALTLLLPLTACHEDVIGPNGGDDKTGTVSLRSMAVEVNNAEKVISRVGIDLSDFIVQIYNSEGTRVNQWTYGTMPEVFELPVGSYRVHVYSHEVQKAEWEHPYFVGDKEFTITDNTITEIGVVTCTLANIKVSIRFSDDLVRYMGDDCKVTVIANDEGTLEFTKDEKRSGYFEALAGSSTLVATFTGTVGGHYETIRHICNDVEGGQHRIITFKLKNPNPPVDENGNIIIGEGGIGLDVSVEDINLNANVNYSEPVLPGGDRPGQEDPGPGPDPEKVEITFTSDDVDFEAVNPIKDHVVVKIDAKYGIEHLQVTISSSNENFMASVSELLPLKFDLAYPGDDNEKLASLGFPTGADVIGKTHIDFDISQFVPLLGSFPGTHNFQISVTDSKDKQLVKTLTFKS